MPSDGSAILAEGVDISYIELSLSGRYHRETSWFRSIVPHVLFPSWLRLTLIRRGMRHPSDWEECCQVVDFVGIASRGPGFVFTQTLFGLDSFKIVDGNTRPSPPVAEGSDS